MQPKSSVKFDKKSFDIIKNTIENISASHKGRIANPGYATDLPKIVGLKLTNMCNLRCKHCYEWNENGYHHEMEYATQNKELDFDIIKKIMNETNQVQSSLYLWGGEPLCYSRFDDLANILEKESRITAICTNGVLLEQKIDSILKLGELLELLIALDGFELESDSIRGKGSYRKVLNAIDLLLDLRRKKLFLGKISLHIVISQNMIGKIYDFLSFFEEKGVDCIIVCFPWYIAQQLSDDMTAYFNKNFLFLEKDKIQKMHSWNAFKYSVNSSYSKAIIEELDRIKKKTWANRVRIQPALKNEEVCKFLNGEHVNAQSMKKCYSISTRMDVLPDGSISSCKHFPEFTIGSLVEHTVHDLWNSEKFRKVRETIDKELMPICSKCNNLYLHGK